MRLSEEFHRLEASCIDREMNLRQLINLIGPRSGALISLVCAIPFLIFIPLPGLSILFGIMIALCGYSMAFDRDIWLPRWALKKKISGKLLSQAFKKGGKILVKIEKVVRPRGHFLKRHLFLEKVNGFLIFLCGLLLILPLPPGTNFTPGLNIFLLSIGILEEDGLFVVLGYIASLINFLLFILFPIYLGARILSVRMVE